MKKRLTLETVQKSMLKSQARDKGWTLCVGAGISTPLFPTWEELVRDIILDIHPQISSYAVNEIVSHNNLDTLIQAAYNIKNRDYKFEDYLSEKLYNKLKQNIEPKYWSQFCELFTCPHANSYDIPNWKPFIELRDKIFKGTTAYSLAKLIATIGFDVYKPNAILSFNAEPLLFALINSFTREKAIQTGKTTPELVELVTNSIVSYSKNKIPYCFCHGALLSWLATKQDKRYDVDSKLVFLENQYLHMSNNSFSWQSTIFLNHCINSAMVFIGVSLSDPNMRKWLSWVQYERSADINQSVDSTKHFWITKEPDNEETMKWMEASVYHLGVRIIWIKEWNEATNALKKILGI